MSPVFLSMKIKINISTKGGPRKVKAKLIAARKFAEDLEHYYKSTEEDDDEDFPEDPELSTDVNASLWDYIISKLIRKQ